MIIDDAVSTTARRVEILMVEDNPGDVRLTQEALKEGHLWNRLSVAKDGMEAMEYLRRVRATCPLSGGRFACSGQRLLDEQADGFALGDNAGIGISSFYRRPPRRRRGQVERPVRLGWPSVLE